ncbi:hypothetical protein Taro_029827 [Colocasia esculenta]|uniref:BHLH domain-containing protein n=1 Tax=Colocasia esculenta TaxID=4460 RepID=A0A843VES2_COLES|nr:hypothetical protein [Colocasia esculenta]
MPPEMLLQSLHQQLPGEINHSIPVMPPAAADMTVLERQIARLQWRQQQQLQPQSQLAFFADAIAADTLLVPTPYSLPQHIFPPSTMIGLQAASLCGGQGMSGHDLSGGSASAWPDLTHYPFLCNPGTGEGVLGGGGGAAISRTFSCPPPHMSNVESRGRLSPPASDQLQHAATGKQGGAAAAATGGKLSTDGSRQSSKKRKSTEGSHEVEEDDDKMNKMIKVENTDTLVEPKVESPASTVITTTANCCKESNNRDSSSSASREKKKAAPEPSLKTDYIHVRARRGQATDSHSLAERVRREKISERMKLLQGLVPGCNKVTGKAGMLDEIINYVQSLQRQVEFLSMKLAAVTPALDFNLDALITKEMSTLAGGCGIPPPQMGLPPELLGLSFLHQFNSLQQQAMTAAAAAAAECCSLPVPMVSSCCNSAQEALRGFAGAAPVSAADPDSCSFPDSCNTLVHPRPPQQLTTCASWEGELQSFYASTMEGFEPAGSTPAAAVAVDAPVAPSSTFQPLISPR